MKVDSRLRGNDERNNAMQPKANGDRQNNDFPHWIVWQTGAPVELDGGLVHAAGNAMPQVRSAAHLAAVGDLDAQIAHLQGAVIDSLAQVLQGMQPSRAQLTQFHADIASATLVAANSRLAAVGVVLLDLNIESITVDL